MLKSFSISILLGLSAIAALVSAVAIDDAHVDSKVRAGCREGERRCVGSNNPSLYYRCTNNQWVLFSCGNGFRCGVDGGPGGPGGPGSGRPGPQCLAARPPPPACFDGQRRCVGQSSQGLYYLCSNNEWRLYSCGNGYQCTATGPLQATCTPVAPQCTNGLQRCAGPQNPAGYLTCVNGQWQSQSCRPQDACVNIPGGQINCIVGARHSV